MYRVKDVLVLAWLNKFDFHMVIRMVDFGKKYVKNMESFLKITVPKFNFIPI